MIKAWRESAPAITASAWTVILGLLCLGFSQLNSNKSLGPSPRSASRGTYVVMMTFLPVVLSAVGRWVFWPRKPRTDGATDLATHGCVDGSRTSWGADTGPRGSAPPSCWR